MYPINKRATLLIIGLLLLIIGILASCSQEPVEVTRVQTETVEVTVEVPVEVPGPEVEVEVTRVVEVIVEPDVPVIPYEAQWLGSAHADASAEAFIHWDEDDPAQIPESCAKCHSTPGYLDFIGADGSVAGVVDQPAPIGTTVTCEACHNDTTATMTSVTFPSGVEVAGLGDEARCMQCHQGRHSTVSVNQSIVDAGVADDPDAVSEDLGFSNIHYYAAAATQYGTIAMGGYEYEGQSYDSRFEHVEGYNTCNSCHDPHTLEIEFDDCVACHDGLNSSEDLLDLRTPGSLVDYDGDGDMQEGIYYEIEGLRDLLYQAMLAYAAEVPAVSIVYDSHSYPYFFIDTNDDGEASEDEAAFPNRYNAWTPRLAKAAYNYQVSLKDPGRYAHGGKYIIQLLYDSLADLNAGLTEPIDTSNLRRIDHGHFAGSEEAFRHWDEDGFVPASCSKCHSADGLPFFLEEGVNISHDIANGLSCATCHNDLNTFSIYEVTEVQFPSGATVSLGENDFESNLCISCHQGRQSTVDVNRLIAELPDDDVSENLRFLNIHYFAAGATLLGTEVQGAYEYADQTYIGRNEHVGAFNSCNECHNTHMLEVEVQECTECHENVSSKADLTAIRTSELDFDGDGDVTEGLAGEIETMREMLYIALQDYAANNAGAESIIYSSAAYPYYFTDTNGDSLADADEVNFGNRYSSWTPRLLRASYNYQYATKDPGGYAHNGLYLIQILYDALNDIGADTSNMTRP